MFIFLTQICKIIHKFILIMVTYSSLLLKTNHKLQLFYQKFLSSFNRSTPFPRTRLLRPRGRNVDRQLALHLRPPLPEAEEHGMQKFDFRGNDSNLQVRARDPADPARSFDRTRSRLRRKRSRGTSLDFELQDEVLHQRKKGKVLCLSRISTRQGSTSKKDWYQTSIYNFIILMCLFRTSINLQM